MSLNDKIIGAFGADKVKWIKGIMAYFLIVIITNLISPLTESINSIGWQAVWVTYVLIVMNAGVMVGIGFIVFFLGKPIMPTGNPAIDDEEYSQFLAWKATQPITVPEPEVEPEIDPENLIPDEEEPIPE